MALSEKQSSSSDSKLRSARISVVTENGFTIVRTCALEGTRTGAAGLHCFVVEDTEGMEHEVIVEFSSEATALIGH